MYVELEHVFNALQVSMLVRKNLIDRARDFNIILDDVSLTELGFSKEYSAAVEAKQIASQEAQRAAYTVDRAKQEKQQKIVQAEGEAAAAAMLGEAVSKDPGKAYALSTTILLNRKSKLSKETIQVYA